MADNLGTQGGYGAPSEAQPCEGGVPTTGFTEAPKGEVLYGTEPEGHGGSKRGAH